MGQKPDDWRAVSLCKPCHSAQHNAGEETFWAFANAHRTPVETLIDEFCAASPKAREIADIRKTRELSVGP